MKKSYILLLLILFNYPSYSQSLTTSTINAGGNTASIKTHQFDWSIGESCAIASFTNPNNLLVTTGVLQPIYIERIINDYQGSEWTNEEIALYPVPTKDFISVDLKTTQKGKISFQLINLSGKVLESRLVDHQLTDEIQKFDLSSQSPGYYYLEITMGLSPTVFKLKKGTYKILKL